MSRLVTRVEIPIYGEYYVANTEEASFEAIESMQEVLKKLYEYEQKYEEEES